MGIWGSFRSCLDPYSDNTAPYMPHCKFLFLFFSIRMRREKCNLRFWKSCSVSLLLFLYWKINSQLLAMPLPYFLPFFVFLPLSSTLTITFVWFAPHNQKHFHRGSLQKRAKANEFHLITTFCAVLSCRVLSSSVFRTLRKDYFVDIS